MWRATVLDEHGKTYDLAEGVTTIGRDDTCTIVLMHPSVSRVHVTVRVEGDIVSAIDEGSTHGSALGGVPLRPSRPRRVIHGGELRVGTKLVRLERVRDRPKTGANTRELALGLIDSCEEPAIVVVEGPDTGTRVQLHASVRVGRGPGSALTLTDPSVSIEHLDVSFDGREVLVRDCGSKHGSLLGTHALIASQPTPWRGDRCIAIGQTVLALENAPLEKRVEVISRAPEPEPLTSPPDDVHVPPSPARKPSSDLARGAVVPVLVTIVLVSLACLVWVLWPHR